MCVCSYHMKSVLLSDFLLLGSVPPPSSMMVVMMRLLQFDIDQNLGQITDCIMAGKGSQMYNI